MKSTQCCAGWISNRLWLYSNRPNVSAVIYEKEINPPFNLPWSFFFLVRWSKTYFSASPTSRSLTHSPQLYFIHIRSPVKQCEETWPVESLLLFAELMPANFWIPPIFSILKEFLFSSFLSVPFVTSRTEIVHHRPHLWQERNTSAASRISLQIWNLKVPEGGRSRTQPKSRFTSGAAKDPDAAQPSRSQVLCQTNRNPGDSSFRRWAGAKKKKERIKNWKIKN